MSAFASPAPNTSEPSRSPLVATAPNPMDGRAHGKDFGVEVFSYGFGVLMFPAQLLSGLEWECKNFWFVLSVGGGSWLTCTRAGLLGGAAWAPPWSKGSIWGALIVLGGDHVPQLFLGRAPN